VAWSTFVLDVADVLNDPVQFLSDDAIVTNLNKQTPDVAVERV